MSSIEVYYVSASLHLSSCITLLDQEEKLTEGGVCVALSSCHKTTDCYFLAYVIVTVQYLYGSGLTVKLSDGCTLHLV